MRAALAGALKLGWLRIVLAVALAAGCAAAVAATDRAVTASGVLGVRLGGDQVETRVVVDLDRDVLVEPTNPDGAMSRLVFMLPGAGAAGKIAGSGRGLVRSWTWENGAVGGRLVLDLSRPGEVRRRFLLPPIEGVAHYRYVIDIDQAGGQAAVVAPTAAPAPPEPLAPPRHLRKVVVIDAGHGGRDPGAQNGGYEEKTITLAAAKTLAALLEHDGRYDVVMTRPTDVYVALGERVQIARRAGADLFISLHADSAGGDGARRGASVYTLSDQGGARVTRVLAGDEWFARAAARQGDPEVGEILLDLTQRSTRSRSAVFARMLVDRLGDRIDLLPNSHRDAGYFVLLAPDVPAALLEMGFISSPTDEKRLVDPAQRRALMTAVAEAIDAYFAGQARLATR